MWISEPTPVISSAKLIDSWSSWSPTFTLNAPTAIQEYTCRSLLRWLAG